MDEDFGCKVEKIKGKEEKKRKWEQPAAEGQNATAQIRAANEDEEEQGQKPEKAAKKTKNPKIQEYMEEMLKAQKVGRFLSINKGYSRLNDVAPIVAFEGEPMQLAVRDFYPQLCEGILSEIAKSTIEYVYLSGTAGTGKTMFRNYLVWHLLKSFKERHEALRIVMLKGGCQIADLLCLEADGTYYALRYTDVCSLSVEMSSGGWVAGRNFFCLADLSEGKKDYINIFGKSCIVFTSPNLAAWKEEGKQNCKKFWMPLWEEHELYYDDNHAKEVKERFMLYGGLPRLVWGSQTTVNDQEERLMEIPTLESLRATAGRPYFIPSEVQHRFIYLDVPKQGDTYLIQGLQALPTPTIGTRYLRWRMADHYIRNCFDMLSLEFPTKMGGKLQEQLFEAAALLFMSCYRDICAFFIKCLDSTSKPIAPWVYQLTKKKVDGFWYCRPPKTKLVLFDRDKDALDTVKASLAKDRAVFAKPRSTQFAGFDAILAWIGELDEKDLWHIEDKSSDEDVDERPHEPVPPSEEMPASSFNVDSAPQPSTPSSSTHPLDNGKTKYALLLQATITKDHSMSSGGIELIRQFKGQGFEVAIIYIVPPGISSKFPKQTKDAKASDIGRIFEDTSQWCMYAAPNQP